MWYEENGTLPCGLPHSNAQLNFNFYQKQIRQIPAVIHKTVRYTKTKEYLRNSDSQNKPSEMSRLSTMS